MLNVANITKNFAPPCSLGRIARLDFSRAPAVRALDDVSFTLPKGSVLAILGPNGAGKTTLLKILSTLILPDCGTVRLDGLILGKDDDKIKAAIGLMSSSDRSFYWRLTGRQNMEFFAALYGLKASAARDRVCELFKLFAVDYGDRRFGAYSTGMKQKMALIRALIHDPELLLLDEPMKSLDYAAASDLRDFVKEGLVKERKKTVVFTTHHMDEAIDFADIFAILHKGRVLASGTLEELRHSSGFKGAALGEIFIKLTKER